MSGGDDNSRPRRRSRSAALTPTERALWEHVARSIQPMSRTNARLPDTATETGLASADPVAIDASRKSATDAKPAPKSRAAQPKPPNIGVAAVRPPPPAGGEKKSRGWSLERAAPPELPTLDRRQARRIKAGNTPIEDRIDLHGLTQSMAHDRLIGFIRSSVAAGLKTVLVITGKGLPRGQGGGRQADGEEPGVLRRNVPRWLAEAPVRAFVVSCQPASARHGGDGAFYVTLRRGARKP